MPSNMYHMLLGFKERGSLICWSGQEGFLSRDGCEVLDFEMQNGGKVRSQDRDSKVRLQLEFVRLPCLKHLPESSVHRTLG